MSGARWTTSWAWLNRIRSVSFQRMLFSPHGLTLQPEDALRAMETVADIPVKSYLACYSSIIAAFCKYSLLLYHVM
jgi:hypothetical protein